MMAWWWRRRQLIISGVTIVLSLTFVQLGNHGRFKPVRACYRA